MSYLNGNVETGDKTLLNYVPNKTTVIKQSVWKIMLSEPKKKEVVYFNYFMVPKKEWTENDRLKY